MDRDGCRFRRALHIVGIEVDRESKVRVALVVKSEANEGRRRIVPDSGVEGQLGRPRRAIVVGVRHEEVVK